ncbi:hypothetical protein [Glaciimonas immobilis]|uniref:Uncharacterized protein n=1 Tax=Glaciimonas immobilis TaxID=728004 RepID=A0A840RUL4_9BURK|nr:hypothetical protein [Glaciimonas immobilis]KAF3999752.1 hypothetical protein HAV38_00710 [Glaciimonas immobilis]MBB5200210.1 hypothetical protein [Glaciimonas immobilis]
MVKVKKRRLICIIILPLMVYLIYSKWHEGTPYGEKEYSPNNKFYFQLHKVFSIDEWIPFVPAPQGSDGDYDRHGYVRAYTADGKFIGEVFANGIPRAHIFWSRDVLAVMDGVHNKYNDGRIQLPTTAELPW